MKEGMTDPDGERIGKTNRKHVRIEVPLVARLMLDGDEEGQTGEATTRNVSRGGLCLVLKEQKGEVIAKLQRGSPRIKISLSLQRKMGRTTDGRAPRGYAPGSVAS